MRKEHSLSRGARWPLSVGQTKVGFSRLEYAEGRRGTSLRVGSGPGRQIAPQGADHWLLAPASPGRFLLWPRLQSHRPPSGTSWKSPQQGTPGAQLLHSPPLTAESALAARRRRRGLRGVTRVPTPPASRTLGNGPWAPPRPLSGSQSPGYKRISVDSFRATSQTWCPILL